MTATLVSHAPRPSRTAQLCTALVDGHHKECLYPVTESAPISLCPLHLLVAFQAVRDLGGFNAVRFMLSEGVR